MEILTVPCAACNEPLCGHWRLLEGYGYHDSGSCRDTFRRRLKLITKMRLYHDSVERRN